MGSVTVHNDSVDLSLDIGVDMADITGKLAGIIENSGIEP